MTYSITNREVENSGSVEAVYLTVDITSLDSAGFEPFNPDAVTGADGAATDYGVSVRAVENSAYLVRWDHINERLDVVDVADGTDTASATDVGEVILEVVGT
jgi:hypothetical protein